MTELRKKFIECMQVRQFSASTVRAYVRYTVDCARFLGKSPMEMTSDDLHRYLVHLTQDRGLSPATRNIVVSALRFLFRHVVRAPDIANSVPRPKVPKRLPVVPSRDEVRLLLRAFEHPTYRAIAATAYCCGLRTSEVRHLVPDDIDSARMLVRVQQGKGAKDRYVPLPQTLLELLRDFWRLHRARPSPWLFPRLSDPQKAVLPETFLTPACGPPPKPVCGNTLPRTRCGTRVQRTCWRRNTTFPRSS